MDTFNINSLQAVRQLIHDTVDFEESAIVNRVAVRRYVDEQLDDLKHRLAGMPEFLMMVAMEISADMGLPKNMWGDVNVCWYPTFGHLLSVPFEIAGAFTNAGYAYEFGTDKATYFKSPEMDALDTDYGDIEGNIGGNKPLPTSPEVSGC